MIKINEFDRNLVKPKEEHKIPYRRWNHIDYLLALQAGKFVNSKVLDIVQNYTNFN